MEEVLREKLLALSALQKVDVEVTSLKKSAEGYPKEIAELERQLAAAKAAVDSERTKLDEFEKQKLTLEQTVVEERDKVRKWESRLTEQRSTREYTALAREIDIAKKGQQTMSEEIVELGRQSTFQREVVRTKEVEFQTKAKELNARMVVLKEKLDAAETAVRSLDGSREEAAKSVDANLLKRYDVIRKKRMPALVALVPPGVCKGCGMNVRAQLYNTLVASKGFDTCPSCSRIIYAQEVLEEPASK
jgi:predicted  nucleic acid-binding Zn-ribbon protein